MADRLIATLGQYLTHNAFTNPDLSFLFLITVFHTVRWIVVKQCGCRHDPIQSFNKLSVRENKGKSKYKTLSELSFVITDFFIWFVHSLPVL